MVLDEVGLPNENEAFEGGTCQAQVSRFAVSDARYVASSTQKTCVLASIVVVDDLNVRINDFFD